MFRLRATRVLLVAAIAIAGPAWSGGPADAKPPKRTICHSTTLQQSTGTTNRRVARGERVIVISRTGRRAYVVAGNGQGWIPASALCKRGR